MTDRRVETMQDFNSIYNLTDLEEDKRRKTLAEHRKI